MSKRKIKVFYEGNYHIVELAVTHDGKCPAQDFLNRLAKKDLVKVVRIVKRLADFGKIYNREQFKKIEGDFWEFKSSQIRLPCYFKPGHRLIITHGFIKKGNEIGPVEIDRMTRIKMEYEKED